MSEKYYYKWDEKKEICTGYIRVGECKKCGVFCHSHIVYRVAGEVAMQDRKNGGIKITDGIGIWAEINSEDERTFFETQKIVIDAHKKGLKDYPCRQLTDDNLCIKYDNRKPICTEWPFDPSDLDYFPNCGYSFEESRKWTYEEINSPELQEKP